MYAIVPTVERHVQPSHDEAILFFRMSRDRATPNSLTMASRRSGVLQIGEDYIRAAFDGGVDRLARFATHDAALAGRMFEVVSMQLSFIWRGRDG